MDNIELFLKSLTIHQREELSDIIKKIARSQDKDLNYLNYRINETLREGNDEIVINPENPLRYYKLVPQHKTLFNDPRFMWGSCSQAADEITRQRKYEHEKSIQTENKRLNEKFRFSWFLPTPHEKCLPDTYWNGFKLGVQEGMKTAKKYFVSKKSSEKALKLTKFLIDEGLVITTAPNGSIIISDCNPCDEYLEFNLDYEDIKQKK